MGKDFIDVLKNRFFRKKEIKESVDLDPRVIKIDFPKGKFSVLDEETKMALWKGKDHDMYCSGVLEPERFAHILTDINQRFKGKNIGLRGIMTSLEGDLDVYWFGKYQKVYDINSLLEDGVEQVGAEGINIAPSGVVGENGEDDGIHHRVVQYLINSARQTVATEPLDVPLRDKLFPTIVVYDLSPETPMGKLKAKSNGYYHLLPTDKEERKQVIIGIYPIDIRPFLPKIN